ncbi:MAG: hypothetical protein FJ316_03220 [SAR202 cluster bacterium]|nr:hypothetical protein [SAR202 cluster bacterium]
MPYFCCPTRREGETAAMHGYHGKALVINLSERSHRWDDIPQGVLRDFIGGIGLGTYLLMTT